MQAIRDSYCHVRRACKRTEQGCKHGDERHSCLLTGLPFVKNAFQTQTFLVACRETGPSKPSLSLGPVQDKACAYVPVASGRGRKTQDGAFFFLASR